MRITRNAGWKIGALVLGVLLLWWMLRPDPVPVEAARVAVGPLMVTVGHEGRTRVRIRQVVTAPVAGRVDRIELEPGDTVREGAVVARMAPVPLDVRDRRQAEAALLAALDRQRTAEATAAQARTAVQQAHADRDRGERLAAQGLLAAAELERLQLGEAQRRQELEAAEYAARAAAHQVDVARSTLAGADPDGGPGERLALRAAADGVVLAVPERSSRSVQAGETLLELGDPTRLEVVVDLLSSDAVQVRPGDRLLVTGWGGEALAGAVRLVEPSGFTKISALGVEEQRVYVVGELDGCPPELGDRFRVDVHVVLWQADSVRKIPSSALYRRGDRWAVFVIEDGRARERVVRAGHDSGTEAQILEGLEPGDLVVRHPTDQVREGVRVTPTLR